MQLRWGVVGLGRVADGSIAPAIAASASGRLVACAGRTYDRAVEFAAKHGVEHAYPSYQELVQDPAVDAVYVGTPNHLHLPVVLAAAGAGKHVLCEKPMAMDAREGEEMIAACRAAGVVLCVAYQFRFLEILRAAASMVQEGRVGVVRQLTSRRSGFMRPTITPWRLDLSRARVGAIADLGVHGIDYIQWVVGDHIVRVFAMAYPPRSSGQPDDSATLLLEFAGGCQATLQTSRELPLGTNDLQICGTGGILSTGPLRFVEVHHLSLRTLENSEEYDYPEGNFYLGEIEAFAEEVAGRRTLLATAQEGLQLVKVTDAIIRSLETGAAVTVEE